uniref:DDE Tnp4 domain-containing protein n=1 Tax=Sipha flava TaxID=143950 RepID=A0A2S2Q9W4_9HEMI
MVDAKYKFVAIDIESFGKEGDSGIILKSNMRQQILNGSFGFSQSSKFPESDKIVPYVIIGNEAFRLHKHIMKPYTRKSTRDNHLETVFNYRLSRVRNVSENAFGLLSQNFRIFYQPINLEATIIDDLIWVCCCLHKMLREGYLETNK